ncbi:MAG: hypothetical protein F6J94_29395 [Moorea sp. SIO1F2]|uniref:hypothetical protein n=1 Tax=Moorena sp. SIO1F2 TaxID=2607819 RepID=UPI0013B7CAD2|nr:hypothetical protein [Moorena sp. SIO1F2]NET85856.1 hypothetical protein [Moorena sp. SIO1F2]
MTSSLGKSPNIKKIGLFGDKTAIFAIFWNYPSQNPVFLNRVRSYRKNNAPSVKRDQLDGIPDFPALLNPKMVY